MSEPLRIVLVGLMGAGKSAVAGRLAECLDAEVIDTDAAVERSTGLTVAELFEREGEASFRRQELAALPEGGKRKRANVVSRTAAGEYVAVTAEQRPGDQHEELEAEPVPDFIATSGSTDADEPGVKQVSR